MASSSVRVAVVQPAAYAGEKESQNIARAVEYLREASAQGAQFVCFPELYPGPANPRNVFDTEVLYEKAREHKIYVIRGRREPAPDRRHFIAAELIGPDGESRGSYRRTTPAGPYVYRDISAWDFDYQAADDLPVFETEFGVVGILICSEVYVPELARALALKGAEILFFPSGGLINELSPTWKTMLWARAIENLCYTAACQSIYGVEEGIATIVGPEKVLQQSGEPGVLVAELDLERIRWLRNEQEKIEMPKQYRVVPGTLNWMREAITTG